MTRKLECQATIFPLTNENLSHICSSFVGLGLNPRKASHFLGNFKQRSWIRIALKNSPILLQCAGLVEKHIQPKKRFIFGCTGTYNLE